MVIFNNNINTFYIIYIKYSYKFKIKFNYFKYIYFTTYILLIFLKKCKVIFK